MFVPLLLLKFLKQKKQYQKTYRFALHIQNQLNKAFLQQKLNFHHLNHCGIKQGHLFVI